MKIFFFSFNTLFNENKTEILKHQHMDKLEMLRWTRQCISNKMKTLYELLYIVHHETMCSWRLSIYFFICVTHHDVSSSKLLGISLNNFSVRTMYLTSLCMILLFYRKYFKNINKQWFTRISSSLAGMTAKIMALLFGAYTILYIVYPIIWYPGDYSNDLFTYRVY